MDIAEKLQQIAEKEATNIELNNQLEQILYGTDIGGQSLEININQVNSDFQGIKNAIVETGVEVSEGTKTADYASKIGEVFRAGGGSQEEESHYDEFWDSYQENGNRNEYSYAFAGRGWNDVAYNPKYEIIVFYNQGSNLYRANITITDTKKPIRFKKVSSNSSTYVFNGCTKLKTVFLVEVSEKQLFTNWFGNCSSLEDITFEGIIGNDMDIHWSTLLTKKSITSIIKHLSDTQGATLTLSQTAVNNAFTTEEWETFLAENKPNVWTINLV